MYICITKIICNRSFQTSSFANMQFSTLIANWAKLTFTYIQCMKILHNSFQVSHGAFCEEYLVSLKWRLNDLSSCSQTQRYAEPLRYRKPGTIKEYKKKLINFIKRRKYKCHFRESRALRLNSLICNRINLHYSSLNKSNLEIFLYIYTVA